MEDNEANEMEAHERRQARSISGINFILGLWLIVSPYILSYSSSRAKWDQVIFGIVIALLSIIRYAAPHMHWTSWLNAVAGLWMIVAPFILNYASTAAYWNEVIFGIIVTLMALANTMTYSQQPMHHHGHPAA